MSDGEAAGWKIAAVLFAILFLIGVFMCKPIKNVDVMPDCDYDTIVLTDTVYVHDTLTFCKQTRPDTIYISSKDTI